MKINFVSTYKKIVITGGAGFIGGALIRKLLLESNLEVFNLDKLNYASDLESIDRLLKQYGNSIEAKYHFFKVDLSNQRQISEVIQKIDPDAIIHLAAESHVDKSISNPYRFIESNIIGTFNLLNATNLHFRNLSHKRKSSFRFLHVSTDEVYGSLGEKGYFSEKSQYSPNSPYSASKASSDHLVNAWNITYGLPTLISNCSNNFGPWQFPEKLIPLTIINALSNKEIPIYGMGENIRDWLFVYDHVEALITILNKGQIGEKYCIGANNEIKNIEIVIKICELLDKKVNKKVSYKNLINFVEDRPGHDDRYAINPGKILKELNWEPKYRFLDALNITVDWCIENQNWLRKKSNLI